MVDDEDLDPDRESIAASFIPEAWAELVAEGDETLWHLLLDRVERKSGKRPEVSLVRVFLSSLRHPFHLEMVRTSETHPGIPGPSPFPPPGKGPVDGGGEGT